MNTLNITTNQGSFIIMDLPKQVSEFEHGNETRLVHDGKKMKPINFINKLTEEECKLIVDEYGPFGEYKGSPHPNGGGMRFRAYGSPLSAFKCILNETDMEFENGYVFKLDSN